MVSEFVFLTNLLLASAALVVPSSWMAEHIPFRRATRQSRGLNNVDATGATSDMSYSTDWAGVFWSEAYGTFTTVTGTFTVPSPSGEDNSGASASVGIDGKTCQSTFLQTGVDFIVGSNGKPMFRAWYDWFPDSFGFFSIDINAGDVIIATVGSDSTTSGIAIIENQTTGVTVTHKFSEISSALCGADAEWTVESLVDNGSLIPLVDFGSVTFTAATAFGPHSDIIIYTPSTPGAVTTDIIGSNGNVLTSVSTSEESGLTIEYVR